MLKTANTITGNMDPTGKHTLEVIAKANRFNKWMYDTIRPFLKGEVLEIGSGIGNISQFAVSDGFRITLSDINPAYRESLKKKWGNNPSVADILPIDLLEAGFDEVHQTRKEKFDSIFMLNVIEHIRDDRQALINCAFMLKPGGHLIVLAPAYSSLYCDFDKELGHFRRYTMRSLAGIFPDSITVTKRQHFNLPGIAGWFIFGKLFRKKMIGQGEMSTFNTLVPLFRIADRLVFKKAGLSVIINGIKK